LVPAAESGTDPRTFRFEFTIEATLSDIGMRLGRRIRELRTQRQDRWTQEDLAARAQISVSFLSMIERGERVAHVETLAAIARALEISLAELFAGADGASGDGEDLLRPLQEFARARKLTAHDVERLLGVARAMFSGQAP
jgi:ribosome-binding protein aMBF1 (putative translation factor)